MNQCLYNTCIQYRKKIRVAVIYGFYRDQKKVKGHCHGKVSRSFVEDHQLKHVSKYKNNPLTYKKNIAILSK